MADRVHQDIVVVGAGPAGLTAAYELARHGISGTVLEQNTTVGGLCRTAVRDGYRFDLGGHRFFTKSREVDELWDEMSPEPMLVRQRLSRIYYRGKLYDYPLRVRNALRNMGVWTALACIASYARARLWPIRDPQNFEEWVTNEFGARLYSMFFKSYTEKVWGIPCSRIGADWAAQRIKGLSLGEAIRNAVLGQKKSSVVKTLVEQFRYPRLGPGQLWESCAEKVAGQGWTVQTDAHVVGVRLLGGRVAGVTVENAAGSRIEISCSYLLSSMPLRDLVSCVTPSPPEDVLAAARGLNYRDFLTVALILDAEDVFPDNWVYIHSPEVRVGRLQNFKNWSPDMVPDASKTCIGLEYFANEGDEAWCSPDELLVARGHAELEQLGFAKRPCLGGHVIRVPKAYPVYDTGYRQRLAILRDWLESVVGLYCIGRSGQHRYNNMDHSMVAALIAARNIALGEMRDFWAVNDDAEYLETAKSGD